MAGLRKVNVRAEYAVRVKLPNGHRFGEKPDLPEAGWDLNIRIEGEEIGSQPPGWLLR